MTDKIYLKVDSIFTIGNEMRDTRAQLFIEQYMHLRTILIPLCINSPEGFCFKSIKFITLLYHLYIEYEIYNLEYNKTKNYLYKSIYRKNNG